VTIDELLLDAFGRIREVVGEVLDGLTAAQLNDLPAAGANSIAWLVWHLTRIQDDHVAAAADIEQVWISGGFCERFALPLEPSDHGYGHSAEQACLVRASAEALTAYHEAVFKQTAQFVRRLRDADLDRVVDERWDPPVTLGVRLVSVIADDLQHAGQAAYVRGLLERR
jgi:uncharacterized damage-inducible protein DinB